MTPLDQQSSAQLNETIDDVYKLREAVEALGGTIDKNGSFNAFRANNVATMFGLPENASLDQVDQLLGKLQSRYDDASSRLRVTPAGQNTTLLPTSGSKDDIDRTTDSIERQIAKLQADAEAAGRARVRWKSCASRRSSMPRPSAPTKPMSSNMPTSSKTWPSAPARRPRSRPTSRPARIPRSCLRTTSRSRRSLGISIRTSRRHSTARRQANCGSIATRAACRRRSRVPLIRTALGVRQYIDVLYREYLSSDLTEPAYGPVEFELREVQMTGTSLTGTVMVKNLHNKRFPRLTKNFDYIQFPSLLPT